MLPGFWVFTQPRFRLLSAALPASRAAGKNRYNRDLLYQLCWPTLHCRENVQSSNLITALKAEKMIYHFR